MHFFFCLENEFKNSRGNPNIEGLSDTCLPTTKIMRRTGYQATCPGESYDS